MEISFTETNPTTLQDVKAYLKPYIKGKSFYISEVKRQSVRAWIVYQFFEFDEPRMVTAFIWDVRTKTLHTAHPMQNITGTESSCTVPLKSSEADNFINDIREVVANIENDRLNRFLNKKVG